MAAHLASVVFQAVHEFYPMNKLIDLVNQHINDDGNQAVSPASLGSGLGPKQQGFGDPAAGPPNRAAPLPKQKQVTPKLTAGALNQCVLFWALLQALQNLVVFVWVLRCCVDIVQLRLSGSCV